MSKIKQVTEHKSMGKTVYEWDTHTHTQKDGHEPQSPSMTAAKWIATGEMRWHTHLQSAGESSAPLIGPIVPIVSMATGTKQWVTGRLMYFENFPILQPVLQFPPCHWYPS